AAQAVPKGLQLGDRIDLLPRERNNAQADASTGAEGMGLADGGPYTIRYYWGCGEQARGGQPIEYSMSIRNGKPVQSGRAMVPRNVPQTGADIGAQHELWPNQAARRTLSDRSSLAGTHQLSGDGLPDAIPFALGDGDDFLPQLSLEQSGSPREGMSLRWNSVDGARAYFIHAMATHGDTVVMWSSSERSEEH